LLKKHSTKKPGAKLRGADVHHKYAIAFANQYITGGVFSNQQSKKKTRGRVGSFRCTHRLLLRFRWFTVEFT
jgi:hypothetical protein